MQKFLHRLDDAVSQANGLNKYLIAGVLIIIALFPKFPFIRIPGVYVAARLEDFLILGVGIVAFVKIISNFDKFKKDKILQTLALFFAVGLVSLLSGIFLTHTVEPSIGLLHYLRRVEYVIPMVAVLTLFSASSIQKNLDFYLKVLVIIVAVTFVYGFGQRNWNFPQVTTQNFEYSKGVALFWTEGAHVNSTFAGHYDLASFIVLVLPIFSTLFFLTGSMKTKLISLLTVFAGMWLLGASLSRFSLFAWVVAGSIPLVLLKKYKAVFFILASAILIVAAFPSLLGRFSHLFNVYASDANPAAETPTPVPILEDRSTSIRLNVEWPRAMRAFTKNPLLGTGYSSISLATDNDYLRVLGEIGILGLASFTLIFMRLGKEVSHCFKSLGSFGVSQKAFVLGILGGTIGTLATALFIDVFEASKFAIIFWLLIGYALFLVRSTSNEQKNYN